MTRPLGTPKDVAALLNVSIDTVYRMAQKNEIPGQARRVGAQLRFDMTIVEAWALSHEEES